MTKKTLTSPRGNPVSVRKKMSLNKATSENTKVSRLRLGEIGFPGLRIDNVTGMVREETHFDLQFPRSLDTFIEMTYDATVKVALDLKTILILKAMKNMEIVPNPDSEASVKAAELLSWNLDNLEGQTFSDVIVNISTYNRDGFSILEKVWGQVTEGENIGSIKLKKLSPRSQRSLDIARPWIFSDDGRRLLGVNQSTSNLPDTFALQSSSRNQGFITIPREKFMLFSWDGVIGNPQGNSPLKSCYVAWKEKKLIEEYQVVGVTKDMGGTPKLLIPIDILNKAAEDPSSPEATSVKQLQKDTANMHAGNQSYVIVPSDTDDSGKRLFDIELMGIQGGGKQFDLESAINQRKKSILDSFGAGFMNLGNDGVGSYALMDGKTTVHEAFIERDIDFIVSVFQSQLFPQLLALNGFRLQQSDMPRMVVGDVSEIDIDETSKAIQRSFAVGAVPLTREVFNENLDKLGYEYRIPDEMSDAEFQALLGENSSRSGDGMKSGTGNGTGNGDNTDDADTGNLDS